MGFKHKFNSEIADSGDVALVQPSNWNDVHISDFASGALTFSASAGGSIIVDDSNLIWDNTNKRLGVGTSAPNAQFVVVNGSQSGYGVNTIAAFQKTGDSYITIMSGPTKIAGINFGELGVSETQSRIENDSSLGTLSFYNGANYAIIISSGNVGIGGVPGYALDVWDGNISAIFGADSSAKTRTNSTIKVARLGIPHYTNAEEPAAILSMVSSSSGSLLSIGGSTTSFNAATSIDFYTAVNNTTLSGTKVMSISNSGNVGIGKDPVVGSKLNLPQENDAVTPTLSFGDGDTGIYESSDDTLKIAIAGLEVWRIDATAIGSKNFSGGGQLLFVAPSATVPNLVPSRDDSNTGIGSSGLDQLSLIAGGLEGVRVEDPADIAASETSLWLYDKDNNTMEQVTVGPPDSGGAGFKVLRIAN